jgi:amino acid adenylation domain-containing protein
MRANQYDENRAIAAGHHNKERDYWLEKLSGELVKSTFPYDHKGIPDIERRTRKIDFTLSGEVSGQLMKLSNGFDPNLHMVLTAVVVLLLDKYTGSKDIVVGAPVFKQEIEADFINTVLALRHVVRDGMTFKELLLQVRQNLKEATENQNYPVETLLFKLGLPEKDGDGQFPLFDAAVALENIHDHRYLDSIPYNLLFSFCRHGEEVSGALHYTPELFEAASAERVASHFTHLLEVSIFRLDQALETIPLISDEEKHRVLFEFNDTGRPVERIKCYHQLFEERAGRWPDRVAAVEAPGPAGVPGKKISYGELNRDANRLAALLREKGIGRDCLAAIYCPRSIAALTAMLAVFKAGGAYLPIEVNYPPERVEAILAGSGAPVLLTTTAAMKDTTEFYERIGASTAVNHIIYLDSPDQETRWESLPSTYRWAALAADGPVYLDEQAVLDDGNRRLTYPEFMAEASRWEQFFISLPGVENARAAVMIANPIYRLTVLQALRRREMPFVVVSPEFSADRLKQELKESGASILLSESTLLDRADGLFWDINGLVNFILMDEYRLEGGRKEEKLRKVWDFVAGEYSEENDDYRWADSYTGEPFSRPEIQQYIDNFKNKLAPYLQPGCRVLEVGCGHGLVMFEVAPRVGYYLATDLTPVIIEKNKERVARKGLDHVELKALPASGIGTLEEKDFDIFICSSVVHFFPNTLYLEEVIREVIERMARTGIIYLDDLLDLDKKEKLIDSRLEYKRAHPDAKVRMDWEEDLFVPVNFFHYLQRKYPEIRRVEYHGKQGDIENELTRFRYDVILHIGRDVEGPVQAGKGKRIYTRRDIEDIEAVPSACVPDEVKTAAVEVVDGAGLEHYAGKNILSVNEQQDLSYVIYTSGTTGKPKGVSIHHRGMINHLYGKIDDLSLTGEDIVEQTASASFDISVWQFLAALLVGGAIYIIDRDTVMDPPLFLRALRSGGVTILESVPSLMTAFLEDVEQSEDKELPHLRWMIPTGEALSPLLARKWYAHYPGIKLLNAYGPTEASDDVTHYVVEEPPAEDRVTVPIGKPLQNTHIYILDRHLNLCPVGVRGEICVAGLGVGRGYWRDLGKTEAVFVPNPYLSDIGDENYGVVYRTGDIGYFREDGHVECLGRLDHQVKIRGNRIELGEIENRLGLYPAVKEAVVIDREDDRGNKYLCAYMVADETRALTHPLDAAPLKGFIGQTLPDYMVPSYYVRMERIPLTANGKVDRKALPEPETAHIEEELIPPRDEVEKKLAGIWASVLSLEPGELSIDANFFDMGGHSLRATLLATRIHKTFGVKLPLTEIFSSPTIRDLADFLRDASGNTFVSLEPAEQKEYYRLSPVQQRLYLVHHLDPRGTGYNITQVMRMRGKVEPGMIEKIFHQLIRRHESLRTSFIEMGGVPAQVIHDTEAVAFEVRYIEEPAGEVKDLIREFIRPFDLSQVPLLRVGLVKTDKESYLLMVDVHHIISDGISHDLLKQDFAALYRGDTLSPLRLQYKDYAEWQNTEVRQEEIRRQESYWLEQFADGPPPLKLPTDYVRPPLQRFEGGDINFDMGKELTAALRQYAHHHDVTLFILLLGLYDLLLSKLSGQDDIVIGTPVAGRTHGDLEPIVGMFVNTLALRSRIPRDQSFGVFLGELKTGSLEAFDNQDYPFDQLVDKVVKEKDVSRNPLFDAMLILQNFEVSEAEVPDVGLSQVEFDYLSTRFDLNLQALESKENLHFLLQYSSTLFKRETVERFADYYKQLAAAVVEPAHGGFTLAEIMKQPKAAGNRMMAAFSDDLEDE